MRRLHDLDSKDREILTLLEAEGRRANSEIARLTGLSPPTVAERIGRLRDIGVIRGFTIDIDPARIGLPLAAIIEFQPRSNDDSAAIAAISRNPAVRGCYRVTGPSLLMLMVRVADHAALKALLDEFTRYGDTKTAVILSAETENRPFFGDPKSPAIP